MGLTAEEVLASVPRRMLIDSGWVPAADGAEFAVDNPATGEVLARVPDAGIADAELALDAADRAQKGWAATPPRVRSEILDRAFGEMTARADQLATLMTLENGKPLAESRAELAYAAEFFRWFAEEAVRIDGRYTVAPGGAGRLLVMKQPVGPCLLVTPWNFPAAMITRKVGPAIAAGCTMIVKPPEETPLTTLVLAEILLQAGLPPGVLNVVTTARPAEVAGRLLSDFRLRKVSFTGSTEVGRLILKGASDQILNSSLELGGNAPFIVFDDADLDQAVEGAMVAKMRNIGQACTSANRFYVAEAIGSEFAARLSQRIGAQKVGPGLDPSSQVGPLINEPGRAKVAELLDDMVARGGKVLVGGSRIEAPGYFFQPTVVTGVTQEARAMREEIFGPVAPIATFEAEVEALRWANATEFGLVAYVFTRDIGRAMRMVEGLEYGMVGLNTGLVSNPAAPFGGFKHSGLGREGGREGIDEYLETKYVNLAW